MFIKISKASRKSQIKIINLAGNCKFFFEFKWPHALKASEKFWRNNHIINVSFINNLHQSVFVWNDYEHKIKFDWPYFNILSINLVSESQWKNIEKKKGSTLPLLSGLQSEAAKVNEVIRLFFKHLVQACYLLLVVVLMELSFHCKLSSG